MNTRLLIIIGIVFSVIVTIPIIFMSSFDTQEYSKENPYEFSALAFYSKESLSIMCPTNNCDTHLQLNISSKIPAILQGYKICNEFSCVNVDNIHFSSNDHGIIPIFDENKWKIGDKITIKVQVTTKYDETITHPEPMPVFIDLGESEIHEMGVILQDSADFNEKHYSNQECAELFDKTFDTWKQYVDENYGGPGQPILEPLTVDEIISGWEGGQEFRDSDCRFRVNDWTYIVKHQDIVWGNIDWPELKAFS